MSGATCFIASLPATYLSCCPPPSDGKCQSRPLQCFNIIAPESDDRARPNWNSKPCLASSNLLVDKFQLCSYRRWIISSSVIWSSAWSSVSSVHGAACEIGCMLYPVLALKPITGSNSAEVLFNATQFNIAMFPALDSLWYWMHMVLTGGIPNLANNTTLYNAAISSM